MCVGGGGGGELWGWVFCYCSKKPSMSKKNYGGDYIIWRPKLRGGDIKFWIELL